MPGMEMKFGWSLAHGAEAHQGVDGGSVGELDEFAEFGGGVGGDDAAAGVDQRALGFLDQLGGAADLAGVALGEDLVAGKVDGGDRLVVAHAPGSTSLVISTRTGPGRPVEAT